MFFLKKIVSRLLFPVPLCLELLVAGMLLDWWLGRKRLGRTLMVVATLLLLLLSSQPVAQGLIAQFELQHPPLGGLGELPAEAREARFVVVLTGGVAAVEGFPITRQMDSHSLMRLVEGARVHALCDDAQVILSGGYGADPDTPAAELTNVRLMTTLGVPLEDIVAVNVSRDTDDEARNLAPLLGEEPFVLVASASHMPRAVTLFEQQGLRPIPAPTDFHVGLRRLAIVEDAIPGAGYLYLSERAVYETLGSLWAQVLGWLERG